MILKKPAKSTMDNPKRPRLKVLPRPSRSPDLDINGNLRMGLKRAIHARQLKNLTELEASFKEVWVKITLTGIEKFLAATKSIYKL